MEDNKDNRKEVLNKLSLLWDKVPELSLGHLISLSVKQDLNLYQMSDQELIKCVSSFVSAMEYQKKVRG